MKYIISLRHKIKFTLLLTLLFTGVKTQAQQIGIGTNMPDTSAILDIQSTSAGVLIPRMTSAERLAVYTPSQGLLVFDITTNGFWFYNGTIWTMISGANVSLDQAYDYGGMGLGKEIVADSGAVHISGKDGFLVTSDSLDHITGADSILVSGSGTRMFFNPKKSAFRAGTVFHDTWDNANVGSYSAAFGINNEASGMYSFSSGFNNEAQGSASTAMGSYCTATSGSAFAAGNRCDATGWISTALGDRTKAIGLFSTSLGGRTEAHGRSSIAANYQTKAFGSYSASFGQNTLSNGFASFVIGVNNDTIESVEITASLTTPLFIVGNGDSPFSRSNAFVIRRDGRVTINEEYTFPVLDGNVNQVLKTDGSGQLSFMDETDFNTDNQKIDTFSFLGDSLLRISLENDEVPFLEVNLSALKDGVGTDTQNLSFLGTDLSIENGNTIDLSILQDGTGTDTQTLNLLGVNLSISGGNTINVSSLQIDTQKLSLSGTNLTISTGNTIDVSSLQDGVGEDWTLTGNATTDTATNFIGTTDDMPLRFKLNNTWAGQWDNTKGNYFIGKNAGINNVSGVNNVGIGNEVGFSNNGNGNVFIGNQAGYSETGSDKLYIDNSDTIEPLIFGDFEENKLTINGNQKIMGSLTFNSSSENITADMSVLNVASRSLINLNSTDIPSNRNIILADGNTIGQIIYIVGESSGANGIRFNDGFGATFNLELSATRILQENDVLHLVWNGQNWLEVSFSDN